MIGFMKKDFLMIKSNFPLIGILLVIYTGLGFLGKMDISFLLPFLSVMIMISTFSYDHYNKWDVYSITLPNGRINNVRSKYLTTILMILFVSVFMLLLSFFLSYINTNPINYEQILETMFGTIFATFMILSIMYPIIYKFGLEKARIGIFLFVVGFVILVNFLWQSFDLSSFLRFSEAFTNVIALLLPVILFLMILISYKISIKIFLKKEF